MPPMSEVTIDEFSSDDPAVCEVSGTAVVEVDVDSCCEELWTVKCACEDIRLLNRVGRGQEDDGESGRGSSMLTSVVDGEDV